MTPPAVRVEGAVKRFGATAALDGAGLEVSAGMVFGLLAVFIPLSVWRYRRMS